MHLAYRGTFNEGNKIKHSTAQQCYYFQIFTVEKLSMKDILKSVQVSLV